MRVAALQYDISWEDPPANHRRLLPWIDTAVAADARLLVLPEMYACGFSMNTEAIAEPMDGPSTAFLRDQARRTGMWICGSIPERARPQDRPRNTMVLAAPDGKVTRYHKIHPFTFAEEHRHYDAGHTYTTIEIEGVRVTLFICYDLRFADAFWETASSTDCYIVVANWPEQRRYHWQALLRARAIENQAYVVGVNRVGSAAKLSYAGDTAIIDPAGEVLAEAKRTETLIFAPVEAARVRDARDAYPFLRDRRT
ncbi:MAG: carbon-nitrogen family hydrolase [Nannocystaceae bacterium]